MQRIRKGDKVKVLVGKDSGKESTVEKVLAKKDQVIVSGVNMYKRHINAKRAGMNQGGEIEIVKPLNLSNVALICPNCKKTTRVGFKVNGDNKVRICKKCGKEIIK